MERTSAANLAQQRRSSLRNTAQPGQPFIYRTESKVKGSFHKIIFKKEQKGGLWGDIIKVLEKTWEECCWFERVIDRLSNGKGLKDTPIPKSVAKAYLKCFALWSSRRPSQTHNMSFLPARVSIKTNQNKYQALFGTGQVEYGGMAHILPCGLQNTPKSWGRLPTFNWKKVILEDFQKFFFVSIKEEMQSLGGNNLKVLEKTWHEWCWFERVIDRLSTGKRPFEVLCFAGLAEDNLKHALCNFCH